MKLSSFAIWYVAYMFAEFVGFRVTVPKVNHKITDINIFLILSKKKSFIFGIAYLKRKCSNHSGALLGQMKNEAQWPVLFKFTKAHLLYISEMCDVSEASRGRLSCFLYRISASKMWYVCLSLIKLSSLEPRFMCPLKRNSSTSGDVASMFMLSVEYSVILWRCATVDVN